MHWWWHHLLCGGLVEDLVYTKPILQLVSLVSVLEYLSWSSDSHVTSSLTVTLNVTWQFIKCQIRRCTCCSHPTILFKTWSILFSVEAMGVLSIQLPYEVSFLESDWYLSTYLKGVSVLMCCPISSKECLFRGVILLEETNIAGFLVGFTVTKSFLSLEVHSFLNMLVPGKPMM